MSKKNVSEFPEQGIDMLKNALTKKNAAYNFVFRDQNGFEVETQMDYDGDFDEFINTLANEVQELNFPSKPGYLTFVHKAELVSVEFDHYLAEEGIEDKKNPAPDWRELPQITIFVPQKNQIVQISEGDGSNLSAEDMENGIVDYIYYAQYDLDNVEDEADGGQIDQTEYLRDKYKSLTEVISEVLEFAYDNAMIPYVVLDQGTPAYAGNV